MPNSYYEKENLVHLNKLKHIAPKQLQAFSEFSSHVLKDGALTRKEKEIIAVAIAHVTGCPYCIDIHTGSAKAEGASLEELVEAVFVVSALEAGSAVTHSTHIGKALDPEAGDALYVRSNLKDLRSLKELAPEGFQAYSEFNSAALSDGALSSKFKEIIAVAVAHATQCPYCIDVHTKNASKKGASKEELAEAVLITSALLAGKPYAHLINLMQSYED